MKLKKYLIPGLHILFWVLIYFLPILFFEMPSGKVALIKRNVHFGLVLFFFYLNYFVFVPYLLLKKKQLLFAFVLLGSLVFTFYFNDVVMQYLHHNVRKYKVGATSPGNQRNMSYHRWERRRSAENSGTVVIVLMGFLLSTVLYETKEWYEKDRRQKEMEKQQLVSELSFLKSQVNPHFLFNSLNGIYALAIKKSDNTPNAILQLSDLLRHMLYDTDQSLVPLDKEVEYLKNYISLQKLRLSDDAKIVFEVDGDLSAYQVEPLLFIPFVENAFKHGVGIEDVFIKIKLNVKDGKLHFETLNRISEAKSKDKASGIGLSNVKKRLELHYGGNYMLDFGRDKGFFKVDLQLNLRA